MLTFNCNGLTLKANIQHDPSNRRTTVTFEDLNCILKEEPSGMEGKTLKTYKVVAKGSSFVSPGDTYSRSTGRKIAFGRAIKELTTDRKERTKLWNEYFEYIPKDKK